VSIANGVPQKPAAGDELRPPAKRRWLADSRWLRRATEPAAGALRPQAVAGLVDVEPEAAVEAVGDADVAPSAMLQADAATHVLGEGEELRAAGPAARTAGEEACPARDAAARPLLEEDRQAADSAAPLLREEEQRAPDAAAPALGEERWAADAATQTPREEEHREAGAARRTPPGEDRQTAGTAARSGSAEGARGSWARPVYSAWSLVTSWWDD